MLDQIRRFFDEHISTRGSSAPADEAHRVRLAVAALLLEMTHADEEVRPQECAAVEAAITDGFGLTPEEVRELMALAESERHEATDYFQFTSLIKDHFGPEERGQVIEDLWRIAYADARINPYEEHLVRKVAQLLHVPQSTFIAAKHRAQRGG
jgi:uncharacterized tellurite resistance protein B-like protein